MLKDERNGEVPIEETSYIGLERAVMQDRPLESIFERDFWPKRRFNVNNRQLHPVARHMVSEAILAKRGHRA